MYKLDINKGDIILRGKYRNQKEVVKTFGHDEKGQPTINGKRILTFNIEKMLPKKEVTETMKKSELKQLISECISEILAEDKTAEIKKEYKLLKKMKKSALDAEYQRHFRVSTPKGEPKDVLISDILGEKFSEKDIEKAFGLTEASMPSKAKKNPDAYIKTLYNKAKKDPSMLKYFDKSESSFHRIPLTVFKKFLGYHPDDVWNASSSSTLDGLDGDTRWVVDKHGMNKVTYSMYRD